MANKLFIQILLMILLIMNSLKVSAQTDTGFLKSVGDLYQRHFENNKMSIHYSYIDSTQTHNYSDNWDFDGDGKTDSLYFIGTGGAHLYFYLQIILSSDKKIRNFPFIELDFPVAGKIKDLKAANFYPPPTMPQFVVDKFYSASDPYNLNDKIYIHLDQYSAIAIEWKKRKINSTYLLLQYEKGKITIKDFVR